MMTKEQLVTKIFTYLHFEYLNFHTTDDDLRAIRNMIDECVKFGSMEMRERAAKLADSQSENYFSQMEGMNAEEFNKLDFAHIGMAYLATGIRSLPIEPENIK